jgi:hypothetical protein
MCCRSEDIFKEIDILCGLNHENVVYLKEYFEEGNKVRNSVDTQQQHQPGVVCVRRDDGGELLAARHVCVAK